MSTPFTDCIEACQRIRRDFEEGSFDGVTVGAIEDATSAAKAIEEAPSLGELERIQTALKCTTEEAIAAAISLLSLSIIATDQGNKFGVLWTKEGGDLSFEELNPFKWTKRK